MKTVRGLAIAVLLIVYTLLVHHVNATGQVSVLGAVLALFPFFLIAISVTLKTGSHLKGLALLLITCIAASFLWPFIMRNTRYIFWLQDIGLMSVLLLTFARTLQSGHKPLCVQFAEIINKGELPLDHAVYARNVTIAWVIFFAMIIVISTLLFFYAPLTTWSIFVNFVTLPLVALMFVVEYLVRRQMLTDLPEGNVLDAVRTYMNKSSTR
ncbi:MAG: hypothetical protein CTY33_00010 [Methylotenera sp.]|nr:MAG: hypothetical protein CTY33_00010 [Methylotenera sp.]